MGKDLSDSAYKKSYRGEYVTSYKDARLQKQLYDERRREYEKASKKLDQQVYVNPGSATSSEHVNPAGSASRRLKNAAEARENKRKMDSAKSPQGYRNTVTDNKKKDTARNIALGGQEQGGANKAKTIDVVPPAYKGSETETKGTKVSPVTTTTPPPFKIKVSSSTSKSLSGNTMKNANSYSHIDLNSTKHPVVVIGDNKYKDIYTNEIIDATEARKRLTYAGYAPKSLMPLKQVLLFSLIALIIPFFGPIVLFSIAKSMEKSEFVNMVKQLSDQELMFSIASISSEKDERKKRSNILYILAILFGFVQFRVLIY